MPAGSFSAGVKAWADKSARRLDAAVTLILHDVADEIIARSPVDTGLFRSNWQLGVDGPVLDTVKDTGRTDVNGMGEIPSRAAGHRYFFTNSLPYALRLEYGFRGADSLGRVYNQPPMGILSMIPLAFPRIVRNAARVAGGVT
jgi:hypothetical protein